MRGLNVPKTVRAFSMTAGNEGNAMIQKKRCNMQPQQTEWREQIFQIAVFHSLDQVEQPCTIFPHKKISLKKTKTIWPCVCSLLHKHSDFTSCQSCSLKTELHCHKNPPGHFHHSDDSLLFFPPTQWPGFQDNSQWWEEGPHAQEDFRKHEGRFLMLFILLIDEWLQRGFSNLDDRSSGVWLSVTVRTFPVWMIVFLALCFLFSA